MKKLAKSKRKEDAESKAHFIVIDKYKLMYGRVPKVANSSIKETLARFLTDTEDFDPTVRKTQDRFWKKVTGGQTRMVTKAEAIDLNKNYFSFSFVRNPFDRIISCYNNKIIANTKISPPMLKMGLYHEMPFDEFVRTLVVTPDAKMDVHLLPQTTILKIDGQLVPKFVGRLENIKEDWRALAELMASEGLPTLGRLPTKNVRREESQDVADFFSSAELVDLIHRKYQDDVETFYAGIPVANLVASHGGHGLPPLVNH